MLISLLEVCQEWGVKKGVLGGFWGFLTRDLEDMVILNVMDDLVWCEGRYPESFMLISLLEVCTEWGVNKGGTWRTLRFPDRRYGGHGHSWCHGWSYFTSRKIHWKFHVDIFIYLQYTLSPLWDMCYPISGPSNYTNYYIWKIKILQNLLLSVNKSFSFYLIILSIEF